MRNKVILKGNVGRAPRVFLTQEGKEIVSFSLATKAYWKDESGEWQSTTDWHQITVFRESTVRWVKDVLKRGDHVSVEGKLTYQHWTDKYGQPRITSHVVVSDFGGKVEHFRPLQSNLKDNNLIPKKVQNFSSSFVVNKDICPSLNLFTENSLSVSSCLHSCSRESEVKEQEDDYHQGETTYEH